MRSLYNTSKFRFKRACSVLKANKASKRRAVYGPCLFSCSYLNPRYRVEKDGISKKGKMLRRNNEPLRNNMYLMEVMIYTKSHSSRG